MTRRVSLVWLALAAAGVLSAAPDEVVFRSDVSLVRVDAQVLNRDNRALTGLRKEDFVLREEGKPQEIRNFGSENMPVDVLLLLDVSASMRPHVERIAGAAHDAFRVLGDNDRVGIMVFDRSTRVRMPLRASRSDAERELDRLLNSETFNGGTDITRGLLDAAEYIGKNGRKEARRAIVILTDDQTERNRDEERVGRALTRADAVLSALIAPDAMSRYGGGAGRGRQGGSYPGGGYPGGSGGGIGGPLGGIILGRRSPTGGYPGGGGGGSRYPGGGNVGGPHTQSAGTSEIARHSGGDSMPVDDAQALENTLARIRQRYALYFYLPAGVQAGQERNIEVALAGAAMRRYPGAEVRFRRSYLAPGSGGTEAPTVVTQSQTRGADADPDAPPRLRRRPASDSDGPVAGPLAGPDSGWPRTGQPDTPVRDTSKPAPTQPAAVPTPSDGGWQKTDDSHATQGGWRRARPGEQ
jgi:VWFA-related protein